MVDAARIPEELKKLEQWVGWNWSEREGKRTKVPMRLRNGVGPAKTNDRSHWGSFDAAYRAHTNGVFDGVGFVFTAEDGYIGLDLDECYSPQEGLNGEAAAIHNFLQTYGEISPSGAGIKFIFKGTLPEGYTRRGFGSGDGIYQQGRFFTITGNVLGYNQINSLTPEEMETFVTQYLPAAPEHVASGWAEQEQRLTDTEVLRLMERAQNASKISDLLHGHWEEHYSSHSEADAGLISLFAFYTGPVPEQIDRLFRRSGMMRDKWDEMRGHQTYGERSVAMVLDRMTEFYEMPASMNVEEVAVRPLSEPPTREEMRDRWRGMLEGYPALTLREMPYMMRAVVEHLAPLGSSFTSDWLEVSTIGFFSALFPGKRFENLPLNVWTLGIAKQGTGKSVVADELDAIVSKLSYFLSARLGHYTSGSAAGLIRRLDGVNLPLLAYFSEWSGFAKGMEADHSSNLREVLMDLYDGRNIVHQLAQETIAVTNPHLVVNGLTTKTSWVRTADAGDATSGLYSRMMFVCPNTRKGVRFRPYRDTLRRDRVVEALGNHLMSLPTWDTAQFDTPSGDEPPCFLDYMDLFLGEGAEGDEEDLDAALPLDDEENLPSGRLFARVKKVATLLELMEATPTIRHGVLYVREENVSKAIRLVQRSAAYAIRAFGWLARSRDDEEAAKVLKALERYPSLTMSGLLRATGLNASEVERALRLLEGDASVGSQMFDGKRVYFLRQNGED